MAKYIDADALLKFIEENNTEREVMEFCPQSPCPNYKTADEIRAEAIKEFVGRLKQKRGTRGEIWDSDIDKLVEEMVGADV